MRKIIVSTISDRPLCAMPTPLSLPTLDEQIGAGLGRDSLLITHASIGMRLIAGRRNVHFLRLIRNLSFIRTLVGSILSSNAIWETSMADLSLRDRFSNGQWFDRRHCAWAEYAHCVAGRWSVELCSAVALRRSLPSSVRHCMLGNLVIS